MSPQPAPSCFLLWYSVLSFHLIKSLFTVQTHPTHFAYLLFSPHFFKKKRRGYCHRLRPSVCPSVHPSVRPSCYLLLNHWTKFNQIWCVSYSHEWGVQRKKFLAPPPWGPGDRSKGQISFNFNYKVNFKDFYSKLCVCSHK